LIAQPGGGNHVVYRAGTCNIGEEEIARRRRAGHTSTVAAIALLAALALTGAPRGARLLVALPAAGAAAGYLQAWLRFCAAYGFRGLFNFGPLGGVSKVTDAQEAIRDRTRARQIALAACASGLIIGVAASLLPL